MRHFAAPLLILALLTPAFARSAAPTGPAVDIDRIVAIVNDGVITGSQLDERLAEAKIQLQSRNIKMPADDVLRQQLLERMIVEQLQLQVAKSYGIRVTDQDVERAAQRIAQQNKITKDALYAMVRKDAGLDRADYHRQLREQITIQQLVQREINSRISVSESEINNFLESARTQHGDGEYHLSHIFIAIPESATPEQIQKAKTKAESVHTQIKKGEDFGRAAVAHSKGAEAMKGGDLGWKSAGQLPDMFVTAVASLKPGAVTDVLRGPNGFHILKLHDRRGGDTQESIQQTHVRHILIRPSEIMSREQAHNALKRLRERALHGDDFAALAQTHSEDPVSASRGGDLGWVNTGQLVPEFERAMNALAPGEISEPVESPFGVHLIQLVERRQSVSDEGARARARNQIHARKSEDQYEQWLRQLRDEAYVEYLLEELD
jgi:peptidyl-prolyl cis-trans isomerase SurA